MKKGFFTILLLLLATLLLAGCVGSMPQSMRTLGPGETATPDATAGPVIEPSKLISKAEAEALVGNKLKDDMDSKPQATGLSAEGMKFCFYAAAGDSKTDRFLQVTLYQKGLVMEGPTGKSPSAVFNALKYVVRPTAATPAPNAAPAMVAVPGVGDDAFIEKPGIHILYQGYYIIVSIGDPDVSGNAEILKNAGAKAVENLKKEIAGSLK